MSNTTLSTFDQPNESDLFDRAANWINDGYDVEIVVNQDDDYHIDWVSRFGYNIRPGSPRLTIREIKEDTLLDPAQVTFFHEPSGTDPESRRQEYDDRERQEKFFASAAFWLAEGETVEVLLDRETGQVISVNLCGIPEGGLNQLLLGYSASELLTFDHTPQLEVKEGALHYRSIETLTATYWYRKAYEGQSDTDFPSDCTNRFALARAHFYDRRAGRAPVNDQERYHVAYRMWRRHGFSESFFAMLMSQLRRPGTFRG